MAINDETLVHLAERLEELEAVNPVLYDALARMRYLASDDRLRLAQPKDVLFTIRDVAKQAVDAVDALTQAAFKKGMEEADAEAMRDFAAAGHSLTTMTPKGRLRVLAARKRAQDAEWKQAQKAHTENHRLALVPDDTRSA